MPLAQATEASNSQRSQALARLQAIDLRGVESQTCQGGASLGRRLGQALSTRQLVCCGHFHLTNLLVAEPRAHRAMLGPGDQLHLGKALDILV